jgi:carbon-monoxide dehydrogenase iron sulfur subunit
MHHFIAIDHLNCTGCKTCEVTCSLYHFGECNPLKSAIRIIRREKSGLVFCLPLVCQQCEPAPCIEACATGALSRCEERGILIIDKEGCTACELCVEACPIGCLSIDTDRTELINCDLCGGEPQCVLTCHAHCLTEVDSSETGQEQNVAQLIRVLGQEDLLTDITRRRT